MWVVLGLQSLLLVASASDGVQKVATLVRAEGAVDAAVLTRIERAAVDTVAGALGDKALDMERDLLNESPDTLLNARRTGRDMMAKSRRLADELETEEAQAVAEKALKELRDGLVNAEDARALAQCHMLLMTLSLQQLDKQNADEHARRAHALDPTLQMDPAASGEDVTFWNEVTMHQDGMGKAALEVSTDPPGALVRVDGRPVGLSPVKVDGLAAGHHLVRMTKPGYAWALVETRVEPSKPTKVVRTLPDFALAQELQAALKSDRLDPPAGTWTRRLATLGADHAVIVVAAPGQSAKEVLLAAHLVRLAEPSRRRRVEVAADTAKLEEAVKALVQDVLDASKGAGTPGGAAMAPRREAQAVAADEATGAGGAGGPSPIVVGIITAGAAGAGALVVGLLVGFAAGAATMFFVGPYVGIGPTAASTTDRSAARRETARRTTVLGF